MVHYAFYADVEPANAAEALKDSKWVKETNEEVKSIKDNNTWSLVEFPQGKKAIDVKWVYKVKMNPKVEVTRHKVRLVAKGFLLKEGMDFDEVFSLVARIETIRLVIGLAEINSWHIYQMDMKFSFLNGPLEEEVYVKQPIGFVKHNEERKVYKLHKALYGLKQAPRTWNKKIDSFLREKEFVKCTTEHEVYVRRSNSELLILCLYVDELLITGSCKKEIEGFNGGLNKEFKMSDL